MKSAFTAYNYLEDYLAEVRLQGRYSFTWEEIKFKFDLSDKALNQNLFRLKAKNKVAQIRKGFYAIITPEYLLKGVLPPSLFIDDMMKSLNKRYYIGLSSAASLHVATHQRYMEYDIVTEKPALRAIKNKKVKINFYVKKEWSDEDIVKIKTDAGHLNVSTPELTALDLFYYLENIGLRVANSILRELGTELKVSNLVKVAKRYSQTVAIQRLGYLLDQGLQDHKFADPLLKVLKERKYYPVQLSLNDDATGEIDTQWKVIKNASIEQDP